MRRYLITDADGVNCVAVPDGRSLADLGYSPEQIAAAHPVEADAAARGWAGTPAARTAAQRGADNRARARRWLRRLPPGAIDLLAEAVAERLKTERSD